MIIRLLGDSPNFYIVTHNNPFMVEEMHSFFATEIRNNVDLKM